MLEKLGGFTELGLDYEFMTEMHVIISLMIMAIVYCFLATDYAFNSFQLQL